MKRPQQIAHASLGDAALTPVHIPPDDRGHTPEARSQSRTVLSNEPDTTVSASIATPYTPSLCPVNVCSSWPVKEASDMQLTLQTIERGPRSQPHINGTPSCRYGHVGWGRPKHTPGNVCAPRALRAYRGGGGGSGACDIWNGEIRCRGNLAPIPKSHWKMWLCQNFSIPNLGHS